MAHEDLLKKLGIKPGARLHLHNVPKHIRDALVSLGVVPVEHDTASEGAIAFCDSHHHVEEFARHSIAKWQDDALLWFAYKKDTPEYASGLTRDAGWDPLHEAGWRPVQSAPLGDGWEGLRFSRAKEAKGKD
jgi:hypothetical protein